METPCHRLRPPYGPITTSPPHHVVFAVRPHVDRGCDPVGHVEEPRDRGDVPDIAIGEADAPQPLAIFLLDGPRLDRELDRKIEHGALALVEASGAVVHHDLLAQDGIARKAAHRRAMGGDAVVAAVLGRYGSSDHLLLDLGEAGLFLHDRVAIAHKAFEPGHVEGEGLEYVRYEAELLLAQLEQVGHGRGERRRLELERHHLLVVVGGTGSCGGTAFLRIAALFGDRLDLTGFIAGLVAVSGHGVISLTFARATYTLWHPNDIAAAYILYGDGT